MIIHSPTARVLTLLCIRKATEITPVVIAEQHDNIVWDTKTEVVVFLHLFIHCPHLRALLRSLSCNLLDNLSLVLHNLA